MKKIFPLLLLCFVIISCSKKEEENLCEVMKYGTFDVYQKDIKVGTFYRKDSLQVETYVGKKITGLTKVKELSECKFMLRSYWAKQKLDTMNFTATYSMNEEKEIVYEMSPTYMDTEIKLRGKIVKVSDSISAEILKKFGKQ